MGKRFFVVDLGGEAAESPVISKSVLGVFLKTPRSFKGEYLSNGYCLPGYLALYYDQVCYAILRGNPKPADP